MSAATTRVKHKIELIRAIAREQVEKFVQNWFINVRFKDYRILPHVNVVYFADEEHPKARIDEKLETGKKG